ncbi:MAG: helicase-exonuclease AddAB subunit AddA [Saccharofermentanales bacterium]|jgi:ATP-dependent helicase/nuclease subunit A
MKLTKEQAEIVHAPGGNFLVSAGAGSGKTAVLTDRIVQRILSGELDIQQVLVMTFTEAAAHSMKEKIEQKLRQALHDAEADRTRRLISRQLALLPGAAISTIHAFCLDVIRNFYHCVRDPEGRPLIEPDFGVDDGVEADILLAQTLDEWLATQYEKIDQAQDGDLADERQVAFYRLMEGYGSNGSDRPVREMMIRLIKFIRSLPDYPAKVEQWLSDLTRAADQFSESAYLEALLRQLMLLLDKADPYLDEMEALLKTEIRFIGQPERNQAMNRQFSNVLKTLRDLERYLRQGGRDWDLIGSLGARLANLDIPRNSATDCVEKRVFMDLFIRHVAEIVHCLTGDCGTDKYRSHFIFQPGHLFCLSAAEIQADIAAMLPSIRLLFELVLGLDGQYTKKKQAAGMIDFSDFEHLALVILREDEAGDYYRRRFKEIYVDEYQDTSSIQEAIIAMVSGGNCLVVGDIKQSIYRFRHARPQIFIDRAAAYRNGEQGRLFVLNKNFRSVAGILSAVNDLFGQLMSREAGEIDYDQQQALQPHRENPPDGSPPVTLLLINRQPATDAMMSTDENQPEFNGQGDTSDQDLSPEEIGRYELEALAVAERMYDLHREGRAWRDMIVLARTHAIGWVCRQQLTKHNIPVLSNSKADFLGPPVMRQMEALLRILDNGQQDIPLAAVLRAEIWQGGFSDQDLVKIRIFANQLEPVGVFFHQAVENYAEQGPEKELRSNLKAFLDWLEQVRRREQLISIGEMIGLIFDQTGWLERLAARPAGQGLEAVRHLRWFRQWAEQFESRRPRGLHAFVEYIDNLRSRETIDVSLAANDHGDDAVQIMTIHGSKGLEFPVVFLLGTGSGITPKDSSDFLMISESLGIGMDFADPERQIRYPTHTKLAMREELKAAGMAEELRLLYVAMTRAMDRLYLIGSVEISADRGEKRLATLIEQARTWAGRQLPPYLVLTARNYLEWILLALARKTETDFSWLAGGAFPVSDWQLPAWRVEFIPIESLGKKSVDFTIGTDRAEKDATACDPAEFLETVLNFQSGEINSDLNRLVGTVERRIVTSYRYEASSRLPAKLTVSELKRREQTLAPEESPRGIGLILDQWPDQEASQPIEKTGLTPVEQGILLHNFFRYVDLPALCADPGIKEIDRQLTAMQDRAIFSAQERSVLLGFRKELHQFAVSDLARDMAKAASKPGCAFYSEMPFTLAVPAHEIHSQYTESETTDTVLVQGIIDCWYENETGITLVDYKSDRLSPNPDECHAELRRRYGLQLDYYARAIRDASGKPVNRRIIWLIRQGRGFSF